MTFDDPAREALELRIDAYLDGLLSVAEARATERMLADPEVGAVLAEAIALRELLAVAPGDAPPDGLEERIIDALGVGSRAPREADAGEGGGRFGQAVYGASWMVRGASEGSGERPEIPGAGAVRYALGPLGQLVPLRLLGAPDEPEERPRPSWWRPILRLGRRR